MEVKNILKKAAKGALTGARKYAGIAVSSIVGGAVAGATVGPIKDGEDPQQYACNLAGHAAVYSAVVYCAGSTTLNILKERKLSKEIEELQRELKELENKGGDSHEA